MTDRDDPWRLLSELALDRLERAGADVRPGMTAEEWEEELRRIEPDDDTLRLLSEIKGDAIEAELRRRSSGG